MNDVEAVEAMRKRLATHPDGDVVVNKKLLHALLRRHDHYRDEFSHHSGGDGLDCDCVETNAAWARGEIR